LEDFLWGEWRDRVVKEEGEEIGLNLDVEIRGTSTSG